ncbi:hypothetical protein FB567DRAFT_344295 [Paraphoma chrysanthemicola]|uniref:Uncharacterized protein n=1 Tax=Paraphoma chrysanthemicola TaxID=798071 RepID=A0A8K0R871_9PLEO|nr:hypothetical protein FB567DRAFT_344295 [Paraphoma chrysanthemicola]
MPIAGSVASRAALVVAVAQHLAGSGWFGILFSAASLHTVQARGSSGTCTRLNSCTINYYCIARLVDRSTDATDDYFHDTTFGNVM